MPRADAVVVFGVTGDLAYKQVIPAFQEMIRRGTPDVRVVGVAKFGWDLERVRQRVRESLVAQGDLNEAALARLLERLHYVDGDYRDPATYDALRQELGDATAPLYYLAIPRRGCRSSFARASPELLFAFGICVKVPGEGHVGRDIEVLAHYHPPDQMLPYQRTFGDALRGETMVFARIPAVADRYLGGHRTHRQLEIWKPSRQPRFVMRGFMLRVQAPELFFCTGASTSGPRRGTPARPRPRSASSSWISPLPRPSRRRYDSRSGGWRPGAGRGGITRGSRRPAGDRERDKESYEGSAERTMICYGKNQASPDRNSVAPDPRVGAGTEWISESSAPGRGERA